MKFLRIIILALGFAQCGSAQFEKNPPFIIKSTSYYNVIGGRPGNSSTDVKIVFSASKKVTFEKLYFRNRVSDVNVSSGGDVTYLIASYVTSTNRGIHDIQLHEDPKREYGNTIPPKKEKIPFELSENEAVLSYKEGGDTKHIKITTLKKGKDIYLP